MEENTCESFEYKHPLGFLTLLLDHKNRELVMVSFTPCEDIKAKEITSIDWYFKNGKSVGTGTGQKGWKEKLPV